MSFSAEFLNASEAARRLGISIKALRLYEQHGLISPIRTAAGWRAYGPDEMRRALQIAELRALGFGLAQVARVQKADSRDLEPALAAHQAMLEGQIRGLAAMAERVRSIRGDLARGRQPNARDATRPPAVRSDLHLTVDLPWPWGGERFELHEIRSLNYITGPLGSGKTRLAKLLAETLPGALFLGLARLTDRGAAARLDADPALKSRVDRALTTLVANSATASDALAALLAALESEDPAMLVIDMLEQGLDKATQRALIAYLRCRKRMERPLFFLTRSCAILDLGSVGTDETIIFCPANHSPPYYVAPRPGAPGYEALASCLAPPEVRARTEGVIASRPA